MTPTLWHRRVSTAVLALMLGQTLPMAGAALAESLLSPADYAGAVQRQDAFKGAYEVLDAPELGLLFVATSPGFDEGISGAVYALDREDLAIKRRIQLPRRAFALAMDRQTGQLYIGNTLDGSLSVVDAKSGLVTGQVQLGQKTGDGYEHTRMIGVDARTHRVYVTSPTTKGALWIVDGTTGDLVKRVDDAGLWAAGLAIDPDQGRVYVSGGGIDEIGIFDAASGSRIGGFSTGDTKVAGEKESKHFFVNLALDAKGHRLFASDGNTGQVYVFDTATGKVVSKVETGLGTLDVAYNPQRDEVYVTTRGDSKDQPDGTGTLVVIDGKDMAIRHRLSVPAHPNSLEVSQDGKLLFMTVKVPHGDKRPDYRADALDSVLRVDLDKLD